MRTKTTTFHLRLSVDFQLQRKRLVYALQLLMFQLKFRQASAIDVNLLSQKQFPRLAIATKVLDINDIRLLILNKIM